MPVSMERESPPHVRLDSVVAGDMLFHDRRHPGVVDFQSLAFGEALRSIAKSNRDPSKKVVRAMFMFDQMGDWHDHVSSDVSRRKKRSPTLVDLLPQYTLPLCSEVQRHNLDPAFFEAVPEEKLREEIRNILRALTKTEGVGPDEVNSMRAKVQRLHDGRIFRYKDELITDDEKNPVAAEPTGELADEDDEAESDGLRKDETERSRVILCRGIAAALFKRASLTRRSAGSRPVEVIKGFFSKDPALADRVRLEVILDGAKAAQTELGVTAEIRVYFYYPTLPGVNPEKIYIVKNGRPEEIK